MEVLRVARSERRSNVRSIMILEVGHPRVVRVFCDVGGVEAMARNPKSHKGKIYRCKMALGKGLEKNTGIESRESRQGPTAELDVLTKVLPPTEMTI
jgi:hypothetical protein